MAKKRDWREAFDEARAKTLAKLDAEGVPRRPVRRCNMGFTATQDVAERMRAVLSEMPATDIVFRMYDLDEEGRPCRDRG